MTRAAPWIALPLAVLAACSDPSPARPDAAGDVASDVAAGPDVAPDASPPLDAEPALDAMDAAPLDAMDAAPLDAASPDVADAAPVDAPAADARDVTLADAADDAPPDVASPPDASPDVASPDVASPDVASPDVAVLPDVAPDVVPDAAPACTTDDVEALLRALRAAPPAGVSVVAAPGQRFESLRASFDATPAAVTLLERARTYSRGNPTALPVGNAGAFQTFATRALGAALVAWHDRDATASSVCQRTLAAMAIPPEWLITATNVPLYMGAGLLGMAAAVDLLSATDGVTPEQLAAARAAVATTAASLDAWLLAGGLYFTAGHLDNHSMRFAAGFTAAAMVTPPSAVSDDLLRWALAQMSASIDRQSGATGGWAEGSLYFEYGFEIAAPALAAVDRAWVGPDARCVRCAGHAVSACGEGAVTIRRPSTDPRLRDLVQWSASLETDGGWLACVDDSRLSGVPAALFESMVRRRAYAHWNLDGATGSTGASLWVHPLLALALASPAPTESLPLRRVWPEAGTARVEGVTPGGAAQAFLVGERGLATRGEGHERPDATTLALAVGGSQMLGPSGYNSYDDRAPLARADAASGITVEGLLDPSIGAGESGPEGTLSATTDGASVRVEGGGATVTRAVAFEGATLVVRDAVEFSGAARAVGWNWHLRGTLDDGAWRWTVGARRCTATQTGEAAALTVTRETVAHYDVASRAETHPVVRQSARLAAGRHELVTRIACE
ncbi:MAG: hypothetical protein U0324_42785 [Polyangiales bacterium]